MMNQWNLKPILIFWHLFFSIAQSNNSNSVTRNSIAVLSPKNLTRTLARFEPTIFCSDGGDNDRQKHSLSHQNLKQKKTVKRCSDGFLLADGAWKGWAWRSCDRKWEHFCPQETGSWGRKKSRDLHIASAAPVWRPFDAEDPVTDLWSSSAVFFTSSSV
jgi:hypothetical protein